MSDIEQILSGEAPVEPEVVEQSEQIEPVEEQAPEIEATPEPEKAHTVPLPVFMETKNELKELKQQIAAMQQPQPTPQAPPEFIDPEGASYIQQAVQGSIVNERLNMSEMLARDKHGDEAVDAAFQALSASGDKAIAQTFTTSRNPYGDLVKWHTQQQIISEVGSDPEAYRARIAAEEREKVQAEMAAKQLSATAGKAAPSMANISGTGGGPLTTWAGPTNLSSVIGE